APDTVAAAVAAHHLEINRNDLLVGGVRPHLYCLPVAKREQHRQALRRAATSGSAKFFLGSRHRPGRALDKEARLRLRPASSAPRWRWRATPPPSRRKARCNSSRPSPPSTGRASDDLPVNEDTVTLQRREQTVPDICGMGETAVVPFRAGETLAWRLAD
ncbi:MAG: hypothetical protein U5J89_12410, partial [Fodinibius sp.]